jgi:hypothetical protein
LTASRCSSTKHTRRSMRLQHHMSPGSISRQITSGSGFLRELKPRRGSVSPFSREKR